MERRWLVAVLMLLLLPACGGTAASTQTSEAAAPYAASASKEEAPAAENPDSDTTFATAGNSAGSTPAGGTDEQGIAPFSRMLIRNAQISLVVEHAADTERAVRALIDQLGGYVLESSTSGDPEQRSVRLVFKVPAEQFDTAIDGLEKLAIRVQRHSVTGQDVTEEFVDTQSRLRTLQATEARLLEFLKQAKTVEEALMVNQQLTELQGQSEQARGRIEFLQKSVAFSTITLDLQPEVLLTATTRLGWRPGVVARQSWESLLGFAQGVANITIAVAIWSPVWGLILLAGLLMWRRAGRRSSIPQQSPQP